MAALPRFGSQLATPISSLSTVNRQWARGKASEIVSAEPRTDCIGPRIIRLEGHAAGIALELYPVSARVKHSATNRELYSICRQAQKGFLVRRTFDSFLERRAPGGRDHRGSEEPLKAGLAVCVDPDRGPIVDPGTITCVTQDGVAFLLLDDVFSDEPCANDVCKFRCLLGADL